MNRSATDRILADWNSISRRAVPPGVPRPTIVATSLPGATLSAAAILLLVIVAAGGFLGLPRGVGGEPSASPADPSASPTPSTAPTHTSSAKRWGPLAVIPPQAGADQARAEGRLRITDACVFLESGEEAMLLFWPADRTSWGAATRAITFENVDGSSVTVGDGDRVALGGGGDSTAESGVSGDEWVGRMTWVAPPAASCPLDARWGVGSLQLDTGNLGGPIGAPGQVEEPLGEGPFPTPHDIPCPNHEPCGP